MTNNSSSSTVRNSNELNSTLISINIAAQAPIKLTSNNYSSWKLQFHTLFVGYDLFGFIDGSKPCPSPTTTNNDSTIPNPAYNNWIRQDQLLLNALVGSLSPTIVPFIAQSKTSKQAWDTLAATYAKPSRGRIKQVKNQIKSITKGSQSITDFLQAIKAKADELAILGSPIDEDDVSDIIFAGLGDDYKELARAVQARETSISFEELHEKLLNFEVMAPKPEPTNFPITANIAQRNNPRNNQNNNSYRSSTNYKPNNNNRSNRQQSRPYHGFCQICSIQGHSAKRCPSYRLIPIQTPQSNNNSTPKTQTPWQPQANHTTYNNNNQPGWLLDSGASHHITADLDNLSLHSPYTGVDDVMIGDGSGQHITHTGLEHKGNSTSGSNEGWGI